MANLWRRFPSGRLTSSSFLKQSLYSSTEIIATEFWENVSSTVYTLTAQQGSYTVTGTDSTISRNRYLNCSPALYTVSGQSADISRHRMLSAIAGSYSVTGQSVTITYISSGTVYTLACVSGNYSVTGQDVAILRHRNLAASVGQYSINGQSISITYTPIGGVYWPTPDQVLLGVYYGPNGNDYVGTLDIYGLKYDITSGKLVKPLNDKVVMTL